MEKIGKNQARDEQQITALRALNWRVLTIWECAVRSMKKQRTPLLIDQIVYWLLQDSELAQIDETHLESACSQTVSVTTSKV